MLGIEKEILPCNNVTWASLKVKQAADLAQYYHAGQTRKDKEKDKVVDYFWGHVYQVYKILYVEFGVTDENILVTALLHDILEDTNCPRQRITELFGSFVLENVLFLTKKEGQSFSDYARHLMQEGNSRVILVKLADRYHNLTTILNVDNIPWIRKKLKQTDDDILAYLPKVKQRLQENGDIKWEKELEGMERLVRRQKEYVERELHRRDSI